VSNVIAASIVTGRGRHTRHHDGTYSHCKRLKMGGSKHKKKNKQKLKKVTEEE
jgi:hypothetical protein